MLSLYSNCSLVAVVSLWAHALQRCSDSPPLLSSHTKYVVFWAFPMLFLRHFYRYIGKNLTLILVASSASLFHPLHSAMLTLGYKIVSKLTYPKGHLGSLLSLTFVYKVAILGV